MKSSMQELKDWVKSKFEEFKNDGVNVQFFRGQLNGDSFEIVDGSDLRLYQIQISDELYFQVADMNNDWFREIKYATMNPEILKGHIEGMVKVNPGVYSKYLPSITEDEPLEEEENLFEDEDNTFESFNEFLEGFNYCGEELSFEEVFKKIVSYGVNESGYDKPQSFFEDLQHGGCISGMISEFIYTSDIKKFYIEHMDDLEWMFEDIETSVGEPIPNRHKLPRPTFVVWVVFEEWCYRIYSELFDN
jgi:hypothetical protein